MSKGEITLARYKYTPVLGWSSSRYEVFKMCKRQYYYQYYGKYDPEYDFQKINYLKNLTSVPLAVGQLVHDGISAVLNRLIKSEKDIDQQRFKKYIEKMVEEFITRQNFKEIYYGELSRIDKTMIYREVMYCLENFLQSDRFVWIKNRAVANKRKWVIEPGDFGETRIDGYKAYCKVDFMFPVDDKVYILDWKTGKPQKEKHHKQLTGYVVKAMEERNTSSQNIIAVLAYLQPDYKEVSVEPETSELNNFYSVVKSETEEMRKYCDNIEENIPLDKEVFAKTTNERICSFCNYNELCR